VAVPVTLPEPLFASEGTVMKQLQGFARGTFFGSLGAKDSHLLDIIDTDPIALKALTALVNCFLAGQAPPKVARFFANGDLYAIPPKARPIVVGNLFSTLVSKCAATLVAVDVWNYLEPLQLALSKKGAEARVHATWAYCKAHNRHRVVVLQLDFENAYNHVCCSHALHCLLEVAPGAAQYCYWKYAQPSRLAFGPYHLVRALTKGTLCPPSCLHWQCMSWLWR